MQCLSSYSICLFIHLTALFSFFVFFLMIRRPPRSTLDRSSAASDVYKRQLIMLNESMPAMKAFREALASSSSLLVHADSNFRALSVTALSYCCLLYTSPSPRDRTRSRMPSSASQKNHPPPPPDPPHSTLRFPYRSHTR